MISNSDFEKVINCLPCGFTWGSALTPDIAMHIVNVAEASAIKQLESQLTAIKQQFINYENADAYALDMMMEYENLQTMIMAIKDQQ